jgi:hypothetical protein
VLASTGTGARSLDPPEIEAGGAGVGVASTEGRPDAPDCTIAADALSDSASDQ